MTEKPMDEEDNFNVLSGWLWMPTEVERYDERNDEAVVRARLHPAWKPLIFVK